MPNPSSGDGIEPVPVIPVEQASSSDQRIGAGLLIVLGILVLLGAAVVLRSSAMPQLPIVLVIFAAFSLIWGIVLFKRENAGGSASPTSVEGKKRLGKVLSYESSIGPAGSDAFSEVAKGCGIVLLILLGLILLLFGTCALIMLSSSH